MPLTHRIIRLRQLASSDSLMREQLLHRSLFTRQQVAEVTGVTHHQLHNWVSRKWLTLTGEQNPGKGRRRLYAGSDVITVAFGLELQPFGMMQLADLLARSQQITKRAYGMLLDPDFQSGRAYAVVPSGEGGWRYVAFGPGTARSGHDFAAAVIVDLDRIILETLERLVCLVSGQSSVRPYEVPAVASSNGEPWSGELIADDFGDEYLMNPMQSSRL